jgi:hypothetical protein
MPLQEGIIAMRTFKNPYTERVYRSSVTGLDEEIRSLQYALFNERKYSHLITSRGPTGGIVTVPKMLEHLLYLHRKRNKLMEVKTSAKT